MNFELCESEVPVSWWKQAWVYTANPNGIPHELPLVVEPRDPKGRPKYWVAKWRTDLYVGEGAYDIFGRFESLELALLACELMQ